MARSPFASFAHTAIGSFVAGALLASCSSALVSGPPQATRGNGAFWPDTRLLSLHDALAAPRSVRVDRDSVTGKIRRAFLSDAVFNVVTIFNRSGTTRELSGFVEPQGLATDASRTLYVANTVVQNVEEFAPPYENTPTTIIPEQDEFPVAVAVSRDGVVAAINICGGYGAQCNGPGNVYFYPNKNATTPCATVSGDSKISRLLSGAFDSSGTLYLTGVEAYSVSRIGMISGECKATTLTVLKPSIAISYAAGVQVDPNGNVAILDSYFFSGPPAIEVYSPPKPGSRKLKLLSQEFLDDSGIVVSFTLTKDGQALYTAEPHYSLKYRYPGGGYPIDQLVPPPSASDLDEGIAVTPSESQ
jgi:hypothetical protein